MPAVVVLPEPCRPTSMTTVGPAERKRSFVSTGPSRPISSSSQIRMNTSAGEIRIFWSPWATFTWTISPTALSLTWARNFFTTGRATSASRSERRTSPNTSSILSSVRTSIPCSFCLRVRNPRVKTSSIRPFAPVQNQGAL